MTRQRNGAGQGKARFRVTLLIAALVAAVLAAFLVWQLFGDKAGTPAPEDPAGQAAGQNEGNTPPEDGAATGNAGAGNGQEAPNGEEGGQDGGGNGAAEPGQAHDPDADVTEADLAVVYDTVIQNGRVINPETNLDREGLNVGIKDGVIGVVTSKPLQGTKVIDATGLVVAPGFIDNLSYDPNPVGVWTKIADGVTSNIAMHGGTTTPKAWYAHYERDMPPVHFGASFFSMQARNQFKLSRYANATPAQIQKMKEQAEEALNNGALGISFSLEYAPGTDADEVLALMEIAKKYNVPVYFHGRYSDVQEPGTETDTMKELIEYARISGAAVHIDHINSTGGTFDMDAALKMIEEARAQGLDITACTYAYDYWGTYLNSARFDEGWQERFLIDYNDLQIAGTTERLTAESFRKYKSEGKLAVAYAIPSEAVVKAFQAPYVMIGSDAILEPGYNNHPRASGNFARAVGLYVREQNVVPLIDMIDKLSTMPAQRLEKQAPALQKKGRIAKGMDADIVVFDYDTIGDRSTVENPELPSAGFEYVLVMGQLALENGEVNKKVRPGQPIRSEFVRFTAQTGQLAWEGSDGDYPVLAYRDAAYVDLNVLAANGFELTWDKVTRSYAVEQSSSGGSTDAGAATPEQLPEKGTLMLERGYQAVAPNGARTELLSIGDRAFVKLEFLQELGLNVSDEGDVFWVVRR